MTDELLLTFKVPNTDFDFPGVEIAIAALERELADYRHRDNTGLNTALSILKIIKQRYVTACCPTSEADMDEPPRLMEN